MAERLVSDLKDGKQPYQLNLDERGITADFASSGAALLKAIGAKITPEDTQDSNNLMNHVLLLLRNQAYRVIINSLECLLEGYLEDGWSNFCDPLWVDLFQRLLAGNQCQSQIILTTQEIPGDLTQIGSRYETRWSAQNIPGLTELEQIQLFQRRGFTLDDTEKHYISRIGKLFEGHPLVLRVIAEDLKACNVDIASYWKECKLEELETNRPIILSRKELRHQIRQRVKAAIERLTEDAYQLLCYASVYRQPVPTSFWLNILTTLTKSRSEAALSLLKSRGFAEEDWSTAWIGTSNQLLLRQHNLIRTIAHELLKADISNWETAENRAAKLWLETGESILRSAQLESLRGYLEAFYHYCYVHNWEAASNLFMLPIAESEMRICETLNFWGYYQKQLEHCELLIKPISSEVEMVRQRNIGLACFEIGRYAEAIQALQCSLSIAQEKKHKRLESSTLGSLGNVFSRAGDYLKAIEFYEKTLCISQELEDRSAE